MKTLKTALLTLGTILSISTFAQRAPNAPDRIPKEQKEVRLGQKQQKATTARYYYLPEYNAYYDQNTNAYFYKKENKWRKTKKPMVFSKDISHAQREPLTNFKGNKPYENNNDHIKQFGNGHRQ